jgi:uncharacterized membrane protein YbaN (DUF454 family)
MTVSEAREILLLYRPGTADAEEASMLAALALARQDLELGQWFAQHCAFQAALRAKFRQLEIPAQLKERLLAGPKVIRPAVWWQRPRWLAAAAAVALLIGLTGLWLRPSAPDRFANFQSRMVGTALREGLYQMDVVTNDMRQVRQFLAAKGAPADYDVAPGLARLQLTGGGLLRWRSHPVAMVCFDRGDRQMLYLFVLDRAAVKDPPGATPQVTKVNQVLTASWTRGQKTYVLAGPEEPGFPDRYL